MFNLTIFWAVSTLFLNALVDVGIEAKYDKLIPVPIIALLSFLSLKILFSINKKKVIKSLISGSKKSNKQYKPK